ncbi:hypothetical protein [Bradyrhizobium sp. JYMT SZCCT0180]|uniref:hypothetical protein n=1 Tax=Bradyrhizobium sp. JYMT SZCCT0180 TaxID=2807666 RepID=UPI001BABA113|nr:hypothetical protein [Bradyrhizobium sp. JYMT SZCCT0180]MBR1215934.1 hypothetical protein [Bradyrhizobium sp. JYMT SZCCT0180]
MARKAGVPKKQKAKPKLTDKEQSERFKETARKLGVDETGESFDAAFRKIIKQTQR